LMSRTSIQLECADPVTFRFHSLIISLCEWLTIGECAANSHTAPFARIPSDGIHHIARKQCDEITVLRVTSLYSHYLLLSSDLFTGHHIGGIAHIYLSFRRSSIGGIVTRWFVREAAASYVFGVCAVMTLERVGYFVVSLDSSRSADRSSQL